MGAVRSRNPKRRLYRDRKNAIVAGVCAGIADYFGARRGIIRLITVLVFFTPLMPLVAITYVLAAINLPERPDDLYTDKQEEAFWQSINSAPRNTFGQVRHRVRELELRLRRLEAYVTSKEFELDRELKK